MKPLIAAGIIALLAIAPVAVHGDCECHKPERDDTTRWGGNQAIVLTPDQHFHEVRGIVEVFEKELVEKALVEVFDKPEYLVSNKPWSDKPQQNRLSACVTSAYGKSCFNHLPGRDYDVRVSRDQGWNVTHVYIVIDRQAGTNQPLHVGMDLGT